MPKNRTLQRLRRWAVCLGARLTQTLLKLLPFDVAVAVGGRLGNLAFVVLGSERRKTLKHLIQAFGQERSASEIREIARRLFINAGRAAAEGMLSSRWSEDFLRQRISLKDPEPFVQLQRSGRGIVILTGHFGNWEMMGAYAAKVLGANLGVIARRLSNPYLDRLTNRLRQRIGMKVFLRGEGARSFYRHLMDGGVLAILADQDIRRLDGIFVDFFGRPAHTLTGPAELILRSGSPWFYAVLVRQPDGRSHQLYWEGPLAVPEGDDHGTKVRRLVEDYTYRMEEMIRRHPDQWMWMHNRWRRKPKCSPDKNGSG